MRRAPGSEELTPVVDPGAGGTGAALLLVAGEGTFATHVLGVRELVIGRADGCDVQIDHAVLSRRHAILRPGPPCTIQDLGSMPQLNCCNNATITRAASRTDVGQNW